MSWRSVFAAVLMLLPAARPAYAQRVLELQAQGLGRFATTTFVGGGLGVALRSAGRERLGLTVSAGSLNGAVAGRGELLLGYYLNPARRSGISPYAAGGVAFEALQGAHQGYVVLTLGIESSPAAATGWFLEGGVGGGVRAVLGLRWRHRPS